MVVFGVKGEYNFKLREFMDQANKNLQLEDVAKNPFQGSIRLLRRQGNYDYYLIIMDPIYPRFYIVGIFLAFLPWLFTGIELSWFMAPGLILTATGIFWSKFFIYGILRIGLIKSHIKVKLKLIGNSDVLRFIAT